MKKNDGNLTLEEIKVRDAAKDSSRVINGVLILCGGFIGGLFAGDLFFEKNYMTPEIIHSIGGFLIGSCLTAIVTSFFQARAMNQLKESLKKQEEGAQK